MNPQQSPYTPQSPNNPQTPEPYNPLSVMQPGEKTLSEIKRHPIGLIVNFIGAGVVILSIVAITIYGFPFISDTDTTNLKFWSGTIAVLLIALTLIYTYILTRIYNANRWIVTTDSVTQVTQNGLFGSQTSQLPMGNLEDVTVDQHGVLAHMFGFGTLKAQTAGEDSKFTFVYCPNPTKQAQIILGARETFELSRNDGPGLPGHANRP